MAIDATKGLISLADAKRFMGLGDADTSQDRLIDQLITQGSVLIAKELGYAPIRQTYREWRNGDNGLNLWLINVPIAWVDQASVGRDDVMSVQYGGTAARASVSVTSAALRLRSVISGTDAVTELSLSDYSTTTALGTAVGAVSGWEAQVSSAFASADPVDLVPIPGRDANTAWVDLEAPTESEADYELADEEAGRLYNPYGWTYGHRNIFIRYAAGWERANLPEPLQSAAQELTKMLTDMASRDMTLKSEKIGDYAYTIADTLAAVFAGSGDEKTSGMISAKLAPYRRQLVFGA